MYPINMVEEEHEEALIVHEHESFDEEGAIQWLAEQGDEEALLVQDFEDQLLEVCQENSDLAMCFSTYSEARARIRDKLKHRGFWPPRGAKGKAKGARKGGRFDFMQKKKRETLADRIANSTCRRCGQKGHWKLECPQRNMDKEEIHHITEEMSEEPEQEILSHLPANVSPMVTIEEMFKKADSQDSKFEKQSPPIFQVFSKVNEEFIESAMTLTSDRSNSMGVVWAICFVGPFPGKPILVELNIGKWFL